MLTESPDSVDMINVVQLVSLLRKRTYDGQADSNIVIYTSRIPCGAAMLPIVMMMKLSICYHPVPPEADMKQNTATTDVHQAAISISQAAPRYAE